MSFVIVLSETMLRQFIPGPVTEDVITRARAGLLEFGGCKVAVRDEVTWSFPEKQAPADDLYERLETLSKCLESSGRIDESELPGAYATILDAMNFVRGDNGA